MKDNILYEHPMVEVIEVEVEIGFSGSDGITGSRPDSDDTEFGY